MNTRPSAMNSYDEVPYPSLAFAKTHPCHLAMLGAIFNVPVPSVTSCRVLELGCASGGNLVPMAQDLPGSEFVGIDLSTRQVLAGKRTVEHLGLNNIRLQTLSILDVDAQFGEFDYIICHGVFSWVPRQVQDHILRIGRTNLSANGLMYVSYNTYPGWHMRGVVRDMMNYHVARFDESKEKVDQSRQLLKFLMSAAQYHSPAFGRLLQDEAEILNRESDAYLFHEHLEAVNEPLYFHQFVRRLEEAGVTYLGDADLSSMFTDFFDEATSRILKCATFLDQEQYMDFLRGRQFRCSILCHNSQTPDRQIRVQRLQPMFVRLSESFQEVDSVDNQQCKYVSNSHELATGSKSLKNLLDRLNQVFPEWISVDSILETWPDLATRKQALRELTHLVSRRIIVAAVDPPMYVGHVSTHPEATPLARLQALRGESQITTRRHQNVPLDEPARFVLVRLDGQHSREQLEFETRAAIDRGQFNIQTSDGSPAVGSSVPRVLVEERLQYFASEGVLVG